MTGSKRPWGHLVAEAKYRTSAINKKWTSDPDIGRGTA